MKSSLSYLFSVAASLVLAFQATANEPANPLQLRSLNDTALILSQREKDPNDQNKAFKKYSEKLTDWKHDELSSRLSQCYQESKLVAQIAEALMRRSTGSANNVNYTGLFQDASLRFSAITDFVTRTVATHESLIATAATSNGDLKKFYKTNLASIVKWQDQLERAEAPVKTAASFEIAAATATLQSQNSAILQKVNGLPDGVNVVLKDENGKQVRVSKLTMGEAMGKTLEFSLDALRGLEIIESRELEVKNVVLAVGLPSYLFISMRNAAKDGVQFSTTQKLAPGASADISSFFKRVQESYGRFSEIYNVRLEWTVEPTVDAVGTPEQNEIIAGQRVNFAKNILTKAFDKSRRGFADNSSVSLASMSQTAIRSLPDRGVEVRVTWILSSKVANKKVAAQ